MKYGAAFAIVFGFFFGMSFTLSYNHVSNGGGWFWEDEIQPCCSQEGVDYHHSPHPKEAYWGTLSSLSARGLKFFHYKVEATGKETRCGGHDEKIDRGLPCNNLGQKK